MKRALRERKLKKTALFLARILQYDEVKRLKDWQGCPIFKPLIKDGTVHNGLPLIIIIRNGATYALSEEETSEYLATEYKLA